MTKTQLQEAAAPFLKMVYTKYKTPESSGERHFKAIPERQLAAFVDAIADALLKPTTNQGNE